MSRTSRRLVPGALYHVVSRFIDHRFELDDRLRSIVLEHAARVFDKCSWTLLSYGLMTTHLHWALLAGDEPSSSWSRSLNSSIAQAIQRNRARFGPALGSVFAGRPLEIIVDIAHAGRLFAYIHNNPVRASLARIAAQSRWTSHRAFVGLERGPCPANVDLALSLAGFGTDIAGRRAFDEMVRAHGPDDRFGSMASVGVVRARARKKAKLPVELCDAEISADETTSVPLIAHPETRRVVLHVDLGEVIDAAAARVGVPLELVCSPAKTRPAVAARRLALLSARIGGARLSDATAILGMSRSAGSELIANAANDTQLLNEARALLAGLER